MQNCIIMEVKNDYRVSKRLQDEMGLMAQKKRKYFEFLINGKYYAYKLNQLELPFFR